MVCKAGELPEVQDDDADAGCAGGVDAARMPTINCYADAQCGLELVQKSGMTTQDRNWYFEVQDGAEVCSPRRGHRRRTGALWRLLLLIWRGLR